MYILQLIKLYITIKNKLFYYSEATIWFIFFVACEKLGFPVMESFSELKSLIVSERLVSLCDWISLSETQRG